MHGHTKVWFCYNNQNLQSSGIKVRYNVWIQGSGVEKKNGNKLKS